MRDYPLEEILLPMGGTTVKDADKMDEIWESDEYVAEEKIDGSRYLSLGGRMFSRRVSVKDGLPVEKTENVPHLHEILETFPLLILDGEIYIEGGKSNEVVSIMGASQEKALWRQGFGEFAKPFLEGSKGKWRWGMSDQWVDVPKKETMEISKMTLEPVSYVVFDILRDVDGNWLMDLPWTDRRGILEEQMELIFADYPSAGDYISLTDYVLTNKKQFNADIMRRGGEGVMLKNINGLYYSDKKPRWNWIKVKQSITSDVIITGFKNAKRDYEGDELDTWEYWYNPSTGDYSTRTQMGSTVKEGLIPVTKFFYYGWIGAVEFAQYNSAGVLVQVGFCSGLTEELRAGMTENSDKYIGECMEISAMERTKDGYFRHPQYLRMRPDKNPKDCIVNED